MFSSEDSSDDEEVSYDGLFIEWLWQSIVDNGVWDRILSHPFISDLKSGTLSKQRSDYYKIQDALFLKEFGRAKCALSVRMPDPEHAALLLRMGTQCVLGEDSAELVHQESSIDCFGKEAQMSPTCLMYTSYVTRNATSRPFFEGLVSFLPCYWTYEKLGREISREWKQNNVVAAEFENPFCAKFVKNYCSHGYIKLVEANLRIVEELAQSLSDAQKLTMKAQFIRCAEMEWMYWEMCYRMDDWPLTSKKARRAHRRQLKQTHTKLQIALETENDKEKVEEKTDVDRGIQSI